MMMGVLMMFQGGYEALVFKNGSTESLQWQYSSHDLEQQQPQPFNNIPINAHETYSVPRRPERRRGENHSAAGLHRRSVYENVGL
jgi:hypothetical protein